MAPGSDLVTTAVVAKALALGSEMVVWLAAGINCGNVLRSHRKSMSASFEFRNVPLGYLITFRGHGTWLHGDKRGSVDRFHNRFGSPRLPHNEKWQEHIRQELKHPPVKLRSEQRRVVEAEIRETCKIRQWDLWAINVRSNNIHAVVSANCSSDRVLTAFKANATRKLREAGYWKLNYSPWAERGSKRNLWTEKDLNDAVAYVEYDQGEPFV